MTTKPAPIGIDLGTTYSAVAALSAGLPVLFPNSDGDRLTPSVVGVDDDGHLLVGAAAHARAARYPELTAARFKRDMGTDREYTLAGRSYTPVDLSAMVLGSLVSDAEAALGVRATEAVVTVPAYFGEAQRQATRDAGAIAGLTVDRIINEPTAAAMAYGLHERDRELTALVFDLGGGTLDVTILEIFEGVIEIQSSAGDARLGGEDLTDALSARVRARIAEEFGRAPEGRAVEARIRAACERLKRDLSGAPRATLALPRLGVVGGELDVELEITRDEADACWRTLLARMRKPIEQALLDARLGPEAIDEVLLVGGGTRTPSVITTVSALLGRMPLKSISEAEAVAEGAAIQAALKAGDAAVDDLVVTDVAPFTLGVATGWKLGNRRVAGLFSPVIERGTVIPASREERFLTMEDGQRELTVEVYQGEHPLCRDNVRLGEYKLAPLPRGAAGEVGVTVRFTYDLNGMLEVEMTVDGRREPEHLIILRRPGSLSEEEIAAAREAMKQLKFHPRETLPNRTALARGDALFTELVGPERLLLGELLAHMRTALETQDREAIRLARERLNLVIGHFR